MFKINVNLLSLCLIFHVNASTEITGKNEDGNNVGKIDSNTIKGQQKKYSFAMFENRYLYNRPCKILSIQELLYLK